MKLKRVFFLCMFVALNFCYGHSEDEGSTIFKHKFNLAEANFNNNDLTFTSESGEFIPINEIVCVNGISISQRENIQSPYITCSHCTTINMKYYTHCFRCGRPL